MDDKIVVVPHLQDGLRVRLVRNIEPWPADWRAIESRYRNGELSDEEEELVSSRSYGWKNQNLAWFTVAKLLGYVRRDDRDKTVYYQHMSIPDGSLGTIRALNIFRVTRDRPVNQRILASIRKVYSEEEALQKYKDRYGGCVFVDIPMYPKEGSPEGEEILDCAKWWSLELDDFPLEKSEGACIRGLDFRANYPQSLPDYLEVI